MLSPRYLEGLSDEIVEIYAQLEADILQDMARRIARLGKVTEATKWQAQLLAETGALKKDVTKLLKKYDPAIQKEIKAIYNDALIKNARADNRIFTEALGHGVSDINAQVMLASIQKTHSDLSRLTITTAYTTEQQFVQQANAAYMQVVTGAVDYDSAMKNACNNLARDGITGVQYRNGQPVKLSIENAVRMNIITGVNQTASAMTMSNCEELGCDLVETTAHIGARPSHEDWQGQIFSISGSNKKYRPFSVCGLGTIDGICGINCKHSYYPYFEGLEKHYTQADLDKMESVTVQYDGKTYSRYDAEERLRAMERNVRKYKRQALTQEAAGVDNTAARVKIGEWQAKIKDFTQQTQLERDRVREFVGTVDGKQPRGIFAGITKEPRENYIIKKATPIYDTKLAAIVNTAKTEQQFINAGKQFLTNVNNNNSTVEHELRKIKDIGLGGRKITLKAGSDKKAIAKIHTALNVLPAQAAHKMADLLENEGFIAEYGDRGYFDFLHKKIVISKRPTVAVHELSHGLEATNPWIIDAEKDFFNKRTAGEKKQLLKDVTGDMSYDDEECKIDHFINPYIGKIYGGNTYELLSMGLEFILYGKYGKIKDDEEYAAFILGIFLRL